MSKQTFSLRLRAVLSSRMFFWGVLALLALQAAWIALSGRFPMAFDEDFHLGIIKLYAHHISPFWSGQPVGADAYGAVARDPSYLYQWLMSFPYRLINVFTHDQTVLVLWLRAINIALFAGGLAVYRRLLLKTGASRAIVNGSLLVFVLIPVVPLLAAQINYDNLFIPLTGLILLLSINFSRELKQQQLNLKLLFLIVSLCLLTGLVKYAFLPIFLVVTAYLLLRLYQTYETAGRLKTAMLDALKKTRRLSLVGVTVLLLLAAGLFSERYAVNAVRYHAPIPDCAAVLSVQECSAYGPWIRDHVLSINKTGTHYNAAVFSADWFYGMWLRLFFAVDGPATDFQTRGPLYAPGISAIVFAAAGVLLLARYGRRIYRRYDRDTLRLLGLTSVLYIVILWFDEFRAYVSTGQAVAINGRYLFPVLPFLLLMSALAFKELCGRHVWLKELILATAVFCLLWGGGALTYILRSQPAWYWPSPAVHSANRALQRTLGPLTPGYNHPEAFMSRN